MIRLPLYSDACFERNYPCPFRHILYSCILLIRCVLSCSYGPTSLLRNHVYTIVYRIIMFSVSMYIVPMVMLIMLNWKLLLAMRRADQFRAVLYQSAESLRDMPPPTTTNRSVTIIVVIVVIVCVTCNGTALVTHIVWSLQVR